jgi:hypothetical protein
LPVGRALRVSAPFEKEYLCKNGSRVPVLIGAAAFDERRDQGVTFVLDLTDRKRAEADARLDQHDLKDVGYRTHSTLAKNFDPSGVRATVILHGPDYDSRFPGAITAAERNPVS